MRGGAMGMRGGLLVMTFACAAVLAACLTPASAIADDAPVAGVPGSVRPINADGVRMESEAVQIVVYDGYAECHADFRLVNTGGREALRLAFPSLMPADSEFRSEEGAEELGAFRAWQDGRELRVTTASGHDGPLAALFYQHDVQLRSGATTVTVDYYFRTTDPFFIGAPEPVAPLAPPQWVGMAGVYHSLRYVLHTGALWSGTIGTAVVRVTFDDSCEHFGDEVLARDPGVTTPGWIRPDARTYQWVFRDIEPTQGATSGTSPFDIRLGYEAPAWEPVDASAQYDAHEAAYPGGRPLTAGLMQTFGLPWPGDNWEPTSMWASWWRPPFIASVDACEPVLDMADFEYPFSKAWTPFYTLPSIPWGTRGNGATTWFSAGLGAPGPVREVRIVPGWASGAYSAYSRPKTIVATFSDGSSETLHIADRPAMQRFPVNATETSSVVFRVAAWYPGTRNPDLIAVNLADIGPTASPRWLPFAEALALAR